MVVFILFLILNASSYGALVVPDLISEDMKNAELVATVEVLDRKPEKIGDWVQTINLAKIVSIEMVKEGNHNVGDIINIVTPGGEINGEGIFLSGYPKLYNYRKYKVFLSLNNNGSFRIAGMSYGVFEYGSTRKYTRNRTDGSDGSGSGPFLFWHQSYIPIPYYISLSGFMGFTGAAEAIDASFKTWRDPNDIRLEFIPMGCTSEIKTKNDGFNNVILLKDSWPYDKSAVGITKSYYIAGDNYYSGRILDSDILLNGISYHFTTTGEAGKYDIQNVVTHEIGHLIGLGHEIDPVDVEATMYGKTDQGETKKRTLEEEDLVVLREAYGGSNIKKYTSYPKEPSCDLSNNIGCATIHRSNKDMSFKYLLSFLGIIIFMKLFRLFHFFFSKLSKTAFRIFI